MKGRAESIGWAAAFEFTPAAIFGSAVVFATATWAALPPLSVTPAAAGAAAFGGIWLALNRFGAPSGRYPVPEFDSQGFHAELSAVSELLEEADVVALVEQLGATPLPSPASEDELVLEDELTQSDPDSRVVRLFDSSATAGEMQERIDRHLRSRQAPPDATQELHDALAALRRSLR